MWRARWVAAAVLLLLAAACAGDSASAPPRTDPTVPTAPPATTTTTLADPYAIPEVIDAAYVDRVLAALDEALGDVTRLIVETRTIPREAIDRLKAIYTDGDALRLVLDGYSFVVATDFEGVRPEPGNRITHVSELMTAEPTCVFAKVHRDISAVTTADIGVQEEWVALVSNGTAADTASNPTPWKFQYDGFLQDRSVPPNPCAS